MNLKNLRYRINNKKSNKTAYRKKTTSPKKQQKKPMAAAGLGRFLEKHRIFKTAEGKPTITNITGGSYNVPPAHMPEFYTHYVAALEEGKRLNYLETPNRLMDYGVVKVDFDFRYPGDNGLVRCYTKRHVKTIVALYQSLIRKYFECDEQDLTCFVTERTAPYKLETEDKIRDGFHLFFNIGLPYAFQHVLRSKIIAELSAKGIIDSVGTLNPIGDVVDKSVIETGNWFIYGSSKSNLKPYLLTMEIDHKGAEQDIARWGLHDLVAVLAIRKEHLVKRAYASEALEQEIAAVAPAMVPVKLANSEQVAKKKMELDRQIAKVSGSFSTLSVSKPEDYEHIQSLVNILSVHRRDGYKTWFEVGACLYNIDDRLLPLWIEFSKKSPKFKEGECQDKWRKFKKETLGIASLKYWAKLDDPLEYEKIRRNSIRAILEQSIRTPTHYDIARVVHSMFKHTFVCTSQKFKTWYKFNGNHYEKSELGMCERVVLSTDVATEYLRYANECNQKMMKNAEDGLESGVLSDEEDSKRKSLEDKVKGANKIASCLKTTSFKDNVLKEASELFMDLSFMEKLDNNIMLMGVRNGIIDLSTREFREGRPDDYVSKKCNVTYIPPDPSNPDYNAKLAQVELFFRQILPVESVRNYVLLRLASCMEGKDDSKFPILTGVGGNGKTILLEFMQQIFGDYACTVSAGIFTQKSGAASAASPEIARIRGVRLISAEETEEGSVLNVAKMKELTGGNKITTRRLFEDIEEFKPQAHWFLVCNNIPKITSDDGGTWRRIKIVEFISQFVENPHHSMYDGVPHVFQRDEHVGEKLYECREVFFSHLLHHYYSNWKKTGRPIEEPEEVQVKTNSYRQENDLFLQYCNERIIKSPTGCMKAAEVYSDFKAWYRENGLDTEMKPPPQKEMKAYFDKHGYTKISGKTAGWKITVLARETDYSAPTTAATPEEDL